MSSKGTTGTRLGSVYKNMKGACPLQLSDYARCVIMQSTSDNGLEKGSCEKEFEALKKCFRKTRGSIGRR
jgi:hypothetical protein